ncbi:hypothetical protein LGT39_13485 [Demequina sp. TTPB684]|uniref:hypothetical protein n=1 Tax=unclassified Demequina TaxID=2620311 RepID=UPI001CF34A9C|nr:MULTISPECIES: hypothetical protein [unclassified Demequina]MCB2413858.1 hypothetical protein [Demequina sp. TTPB684]UPU89170.1 hypothetical protein LGT36_004385 [Demequina sp. TMPB413]
MTESAHPKGQPLYQAMAPELPDIGWSRPLPNQITADAARAIHESTDAAALGVMLGMLRSFWGAAGGVLMSPLAGLAAWALGWEILAAVIFALGVPAGLATIEGRRRARQWQAVIEARLETLGARG